MDAKKILLISLIAVTIVASVSAVSAGWFDFNDESKNLKTHEFNYSNRAIFNVSDELTNKTGVENILFGDGVSYKYPENNKGEYSMVTIGGVGYSGSDDVESKQNDAHFEEIESNRTSQGYDTYIFKWNDVEMYDVYIDLNNLTITESDEIQYEYHYFHGCFQSLEEANIFIETFKINEDMINDGV